MPTQIAPRSACPPTPSFRPAIRHMIGMALVTIGLAISRCGLALLSDMEGQTDGQR